jgi:cell division protein FtsL
MTVVLSLLTVYWHHQMFELYEIEIQVKGKNQSLMALNKQLLMERSELFSGMAVYEKAQNILLMHSPGKDAKGLAL